MRSEQSETLTRHEAVRNLEDGWRQARRCCASATIVPCVCRLSVACPNHGLICVGSHD
jgi:hypothetical protein